MKSINEIRPELESIMKGIAKQFGSNCEVFLHDHSQGLEKSIVAIENGHVTNRKVGDASTNIGFEIHKNNRIGEDQYGYITKLANGKILRSSSVYFRDDEGKVIGALCINLDITNIVALQNSINQMTSESAAPPVKEIFSNNVSDILDMLIKEYFSVHPVPVDKMTKQDMCNLIRFLDSKGAFLIRNSAPKVCSLLKISKFTLYSYLKEVNEAAA